MSESLNIAIRDARGSKGLTQSELADKTGLHPAAVSHFETGHRVPTIKNLMKLCKALDKTPNDILL